MCFCEWYLGFHKVTVSYHDVTPAELCRPRSDPSCDLSVSSVTSWARRREVPARLRRQNLRCDTCHFLQIKTTVKKRRWILTRVLRGGTFSFHLCRNVWSLDKMWLIKVQHHLRGSTLPLPPSSSTTGIKLRITVSSHTEWFVKILSYSVYYTVYTIYMMSITFIHWIIKRDLSKVLFLMSDRKSQIPASKLYKAQLWASETLINETPGVNKPRTDLCFFCCIP